jgi:hypothetical protein
VLLRHVTGALVQGLCQARNPGDGSSRVTSGVRRGAAPLENSAWVGQGALRGLVQSQRVKTRRRNIMNAMGGKLVGLQKTLVWFQVRRKLGLK